MWAWFLQRMCGQGLRPSLCPVCGRRFRPIGGARELERGEQDTELAPLLFIARLVLKYDAGPENEEMVELNKEIDEWFGDGNTSQALVAARRLVEEREKSWTEAWNLRREFRNHVQRKMEETAISSAKIESLDAKVQELESRCSAYASQIERLEQELRSYTGHNPSPPRGNYRLDSFPHRNGSSQQTAGNTNGYTTELSPSRPRTPSRTTDGTTGRAVPTTPIPAGSSYRVPGDYEDRGTPGSSLNSGSGSREHRVRRPDGQSTTAPTCPVSRPESAATQITTPQGSDSRSLSNRPRMNGEYVGQQVPWTPGLRSQSGSVSGPFGPAAEISTNAHQPRQSRDQDSQRHHRRQGSYPANATSTLNSEASAALGAESSRRNIGLSLMPPENNATASPRNRSNLSNWIQESQTMSQPYVTARHTSNPVITTSEPPIQRSLQGSMSTSHASASAGSRSSRSAFSSRSSLYGSGAFDMYL